jgi:hypothetical protein
MKALQRPAHHLASVVFALMVLILPEEPLQAGRVTRKTMREFKGIYRGYMRGYRSGLGPTYTLNEFQPYTFYGSFLVNRDPGAGRRILTSPFTGNNYTLLKRPVMGTGRRIRIRSIAKGRFYNQDTGMVERITGRRLFTVVKVGKGKRKRFIARAKDSLYEGTAHFYSLSGPFRKD